MAEMTQAERDTVFFGEDPTVIIDDIYNAIVDIGADAVDGLEASLQRDVVTDGQSEALHVACNKIQENLQTSVDRNFQKFHAYVKRNILTVPPQCKLANDIASEREEEALDNEMGRLLSRFAAQRSLNESLRVHKYTNGEDLRRYALLENDLDSAISAAREAQRAQTDLEGRHPVEQIRAMLKEVGGLGGFNSAQMDVDERFKSDQADVGDAGSRRYLASLGDSLR